MSVVSRARRATVRRDNAPQPPAATFVPARPLFPADEGLAATALAEEMLAELARLDEAAREDPLANPVMRLALAIARRLEQGRLSWSGVEQLVQNLTADGFAGRAARLARYLGELDPAANDALLAATFAALARKPDGTPLPFEAFKARVEREAFGIVLTAHPTFSLAAPLMRALASLAADRAPDGEPLDEAGRRRLTALAASAEHGPDPDLGLAFEHALSLEAIGHIQAALARACGVLLDVARQIWPDRWTELRPRLLTVATWVGYDLDGRSDILWTDTLHKRLKVQRAQLARTLAEVRAIRAAAAGDAEGLGETLDLMESRIALAMAQLADEIAAFSARDGEEASARRQIGAIARRMHEGRDFRLTDAATLIELADRAVARARDPAVVRALLVLSAGLATHGLGLAHTHVRINATQVHNAIRKAVDLVTDANDPRYRQSYLDKINALLDGARRVQINFGSVLDERTSVKRLVMLVAQMLKYCDRTAPVRFLIAECESAFTVLAALYFTRLFGVDGEVDISPLFETERALEAGSRVVEQLLENRHYCDYVRRRGRLCVQTGYSDAGRHLGQPAAAASIERLRLRLIRVMARHRLDGVELVVFDTHGESIGRGGHPASLAERLDYVDTRATRGFMADQGVAFKEEVSFQGGDGFLPFMNPACAYAVVRGVLEHALSQGVSSADDPFYDEPAYIREVFTTIKEFQVSLMDDPNYGVLLSAIGPNLLFPSGSRPARRQHEDPADIDHARAAELRAIPHNAILQQLGLLANSVGGAGAAIARDPERFEGLYARSARLRQLFGIVEYGMALSDPNVMKACIDTLDPGFWIMRAGEAVEPGRREAMLQLADALEAIGVHERQTRVFRRLHRDFAVLTAAVGRYRAASGKPGCDALVTPACRQSLRLLHAIRLAVVHEVFLLAVRVPAFSSRHGTTPRQLVARLLLLDVPPVVRLLEEIFPLTPEEAAPEDFGEPADYVSDEAQSYLFENEQLFRPMEALHRLVLRISAAISHRTGFFG